MQNSECQAKGFARFDFQSSQVIFVFRESVDKGANHGRVDGRGRGKMASLDRFRVGLRQSWFHRVGGIATLLIFGCVLGCAKADTYVKGQDGTLYILVTDAARAQFIVSRGVYVTRVDAPDARYQDVNQEYQPCRYHLVDRPRTVAAREGTYIAVFPQLHQGFVDGQWRVYSGNPPRNNQEKGAPVGQGAPPLIQTAPASSAPRSERF